MHMETSTALSNLIMNCVCTLDVLDMADALQCQGQSVDNIIFETVTLCLILLSVVITYIAVKCMNFSTYCVVMIYTNMSAS